MIGPKLTTFLQRLTYEFIKRMKEEELESCKTPVVGIFTSSTPEIILRRVAFRRVASHLLFVVPSYRFFVHQRSWPCFQKILPL
jgi:hypothetical protein